MNSSGILTASDQKSWSCNLYLAPSRHLSQLYDDQHGPRALQFLGLTISVIVASGSLTADSSFSHDMVRVRAENKNKLIAERERRGRDGWG